jgi:predicted metal-dependent hydrolase
MLDYAVRRSPRARRARLMVRPDGEVVVTIPARAPLRWARDLVVREADWIERHRGPALAETARLARRLPLGGGGRVPLGGVDHVVLLELSGLRRTRIDRVDDPHPLIRVRRATGDQRSPRQLLEPWLRARARAEITSLVAERAGQLGVRPQRIAIRDQRTRWASAARSGDLSFSWRLVLAPPSVMDYVVVHELAHLVRFGHGPRFWSLVRGVVPDADEHRAWLRRHGRELREALY